MMIRMLTAADSEAMARLHAQSFDKPWPALDMAVHVARDLCLGTGKPLSSFAILRCSDVDADILTIATAPDARGQGQGVALLETAHAHLIDKGLRHVFLEVAEDNGAAQRLYEKLGYQPIGRRPGYYARPEGRVAAVTFSLDLNHRSSGSNRSVLLDDPPSSR